MMLEIIITALRITKNTIMKDRIQIYIEAVLMQKNHYVMMRMPFIHIYAPQRSRYTKRELNDIDKFIEKFEEYLNEDSDSGWGTYPMINEINDFLMNFGKVDKKQ